MENKEDSIPSNKKPRIHKFIISVVLGQGKTKFKNHIKEEKNRKICKEKKKKRSIMPLLKQFNIKKHNQLNKNIMDL